MSFTGRWTGAIAGTNVGNFTIDIQDNDGVLQGHTYLNDYTLGNFAYEFTGTVQNNELVLNLTPTHFPEGTEALPATVTGHIQPDGSLSGEWDSEGRTAGTFLAFKQPGIQTPIGTASPPVIPTMAMSYEKQCPVSSCLVDSDVLRRVYKDLSTGSDEAARLEVARQPTQASGGSPAGSAPQRTPAEVRGSYSVTMIARGVNGEQILSLDPALLEEGNLPKPLQSIILQIGPYYQHLTNKVAPNRATIRLDFTKPPLFDLSNTSIGATPHSSTIEVAGSDSMWVSGVYEKLITTLAQGKVKTGWLHFRNTYDILLWLIGLPGVLAGATIIAQRLGARYFNSFLLPSLALFLFVALSTLLLFRLVFSALRWLLPLLEFSPLQQPVHRQIRIIVSIVVLGIVSSLAAAALWAVFIRPH